MQQLLEEYLRPKGFEIRCCDSATDACRVLGITESSTSKSEFGFESSSESTASREGKTESEFDIVLTDVKMPGMDGLEFCRMVKQRFANLPVIVMTAYGNLDTAVEALRSGAFDFVTKPVELELLKASLERAAENSQLRRRVRILESQAQSDSFGELIGRSDVMMRLKDQLSRIVDSSAAVLLTGESGSGKEVVARALHQQSSRSKQPFVAVNCAALPEALLESELFGHVKGAFTGAVRDRIGRFELAGTGTLFLDEVGDLPLPLQVKLLRVLQERAFERVGESESRTTEARIIAATNKDLRQAVLDEEFREDLYYRLRVVPLHIPPLRERREDIEPLARHLLSRINRRHDRSVRLAPDAMRCLLRYNWPGNV